MGKSISKSYKEQEKALKNGEISFDLNLYFIGDEASILYDRFNRNIVVKGYVEEGSITTPFDMRVQNEIDRFHLVIEACRLLPNLGSKGVYLTKLMQEKLVEHKQFIHDNGYDMPEVSEWKWNNKKDSK